MFMGATFLGLLGLGGAAERAVATATGSEYWLHEQRSTVNDAPDFLIPGADRPRALPALPAERARERGLERAGADLRGALRSHHPGLARGGDPRPARRAHGAGHRRACGHAQVDRV